MILFSMIILIGIIAIGIYDLITQIRTFGFKKINNRTSIALVFCILSAFTLFIGRIHYLYALNHPKLFLPQPSGRKLFPNIVLSTVWTNNICVIFAVMCVLQISYCWIEVSQNVLHMKQINDGYDRLQKLVLFLEGSLVLAVVLM